MISLVWGSCQNCWRKRRESQGGQQQFSAQTWRGHAEAGDCSCHLRAMSCCCAAAWVSLLTTAFLLLWISTEIPVIHTQQYKSSMQMYWHKFLFCFLLGVDYLVCIFLSFAVLLLPSIDRGISICSFCSFPDSSLSPLSLLFSFFPSLCCCFERGQPKLKPVCCYLISKAVTLNDSIMTPSSFCLFCFVCFSPFGSPANISWHPGRVVASWWTEIF